LGNGVVVPAATRSLEILDVGHGNAAVLVNGNGGSTIVDCGPGSSLLEFLTEKGVATVQLVLISHADQDHIAGLIAVLAAGIVRVEKVIVNTDSAKDSQIWDDLLHELTLARRAGRLDFETSLTESVPGQFVDDDIEFEVLAPSTYLSGKGPGSTDRHDRRLTTNSVSAVIRVTRDGNPLVVLPGDIDDIGLENLLEYRSSFPAPVLVFPHHGGVPGNPALAKQFATALCDAVRPDLIVFSIARGGKANNPRPEIVAAIRNHIPGVRIMCTELSTHCASALPTANPTHLSASFSRGRAQRKCCGGTLLLAFRGGIEAPAARAHREFVENNAPSALCLDRSAPSAAPSP
jgi:beta-lactamase superfamily II metal-dependent hydrolase